MASVLIVCTGNICRSPVAEALLRRELERRGVEGMDVRSAGTHAWEGGAASPGSVRAAAELGLDLSSHAAHPLGAEEVRQADLVIAMAGEHRDAVGRLVPEAASRTFTLKELARLASSLTPISPAGPLGRLRGRVVEADELRKTTQAEAPTDDDVMDPLGMTLDVYRAMANEVRELVDRVAEGLFGGSDTPATGTRNRS